MARLLSALRYELWLTLAVDHRPQENVLPVAFKACWYGIRGGGKMEAAQPDKVLEKHGKTVSWNDTFVKELQGGLVACRAL
jgi:POT family proton-dependent oligopeptide transporter